MQHGYSSPQITVRLTEGSSQTYLKECHFLLFERDNSPAGSLSSDQCRAHDGRGLNISASSWSDWPLDKIIEAASWKSANVFARHYLKDMEVASEECRSIGPLTTAGLAVLGTHR